MTTKDWQTFFDHHAPKYMQEPFTQATLAEVEFLVKALHLESGSRVLDIGCGTGRHAVELAKRGCIVTGLDLSQGMLEQAGQAAQAAGVTVEWVHLAAEDYHVTEQYDAVYTVCEGAVSLLGQEDSPHRDRQIFRNIFNALKPGGRAHINVLNAMRLIRMYSDADVAAGRFDPLTQTEHGSMPIETADGARDIPTRERGYVPTELRLMLELAGFTVEHIGGGTAGHWGLRPVEMDEYELMALVRRPLEPTQD